MHLTRLALTDFRNYQSLVWQPGARISVITGPNGSGKTNLLEAVSMLVPGRGLRGARIADLAREGTGGWAVAARFGVGADEVDVGTGTPPGGPSDRRVFRLDGQPPRSQAEIAARVAAIWLTPQMDRLFQEGPSGRRRFLDRLVWALEPGHAREIAAHDQAMVQRNRLLAEGGRREGVRREGGADPAWLAGLEDTMVRHAVAATAGRRAVVQRLNAALAAGASGAFPAARLALLDPIADRLDIEPALAVEDWLREALAAARARDSAAGSSSLGAHRSDMTLMDAASGLPAARSSTGQQKALLVGTVLGHAALIAEARGWMPLLLLDEPMVHLDQGLRGKLLEALVALPAQVLVTGTDADIFAPLEGLAEGLLTGGGSLLPDRGFPPARGVFHSPQ